MQTLTNIKKRYFQTKKEALWIVWACERFHIYLHGTEFELRTDHKPLEFIYFKKSKPCSRIERWVLQHYRFCVNHIAGKQNIADCLSRMTAESDPYFVDDSETYVRFVAEMSNPEALSTRQIDRESEKDPELHNILKCIQSGRWDRIENKAYLPSKPELWNED